MGFHGLIVGGALQTPPQMRLRPRQTATGSTDTAQVRSERRSCPDRIAGRCGRIASASASLWSWRWSSQAVEPEAGGCLGVVRGGRLGFRRLGPILDQRRQLLAASNGSRRCRRESLAFSRSGWNSWRISAMTAGRPSGGAAATRSADDSLLLFASAAKGPFQILAPQRLVARQDGLVCRRIKHGSIEGTHAHRLFDASLLGRAVGSPEKRQFGDVNVAAALQRAERQRASSHDRGTAASAPNAGRRRAAAIPSSASRDRKLRLVEDRVADLDHGHRVRGFALQDVEQPAMGFDQFQMGLDVRRLPPHHVFQTGNPPLLRLRVGQGTLRVGRCPAASAAWRATRYSSQYGWATAGPIRLAIIHAPTNVSAAAATGQANRCSGKREGNSEFGIRNSDRLRFDRLPLDPSSRHLPHPHDAGGQDGRRSPSAPAHTKRSRPGHGRRTRPGCRQSPPRIPSHRVGTDALMPPTHHDAQTTMPVSTKARPTTPVSSRTCK